MLLLKRPTSWVAMVCMMVGLTFLGGRSAYATEAITPISPLAPRSSTLFAGGDQALDDEAPSKSDEPLLSKPAEPAEPIPYWKKWWFWTATGIGVATVATVLTMVLTFKPDLHTCPKTGGYASLGCYGEGR